MSKKKIIVISVATAVTGILIFYFMPHNDRAQTKNNDGKIFVASSSLEDSLTAKADTSEFDKSTPLSQCLSLEAAYSPRSHNGIFNAERENENGAYTLKIKRIDNNSFVRVIKEKPDQDAKSNLAGFYEPRFSLDDKKVYFLSLAWTTSTAIHELDIATGKIRFVTDGTDFIVIPLGKYAGKLAIAKHKYFLGSGTYYWYWLMDPETGELAEEDPIGEDLNMFLDIYVCN